MAINYVMVNTMKYLIIIIAIISVMGCTKRECDHFNARVDFIASNIVQRGGSIEHRQHYMDSLEMIIDGTPKR